MPVPNMRKIRFSVHRLSAYVGYWVRKPLQLPKQERQTPLCGALALGPREALGHSGRSGTAVVAGVSVIQVGASIWGALPGTTLCLSQPSDLHLSHTRPLLTIMTSKVGERYLPHFTSGENET